MERERRAYYEGAELRASADGEPRLTGYAAVFGERTDLGYFTEEIAPGAFADVLEDDVRALFNHDPDHVLGRTKSGTLRIEQDDRGLRFDVALNPDDPDATKLHSRVARGDISGNSFSFTVAADSWDYANPDMPHRTIERVGRLYDVGPVTFPAYEATVLSARSREAASFEPPKPPDFTIERIALDRSEAEA